MKTVVILALKGVYASSIHGIFEIFLLEDNFPKGSKENLSAPNIITVSENGEAVTDSYGGNLSVEKPINNIEWCDFIIIPGIEYNSVNTVIFNSISPDVKKWLRYHHKNGTIICSHYTSIFILGESGLLNGKRCVCAYGIEEKIKNQYSLANIVQGPPLLLDQNIVTTTTATSWLSIAYLIIPYKKMEVEIESKKAKIIDTTTIDTMLDTTSYIKDFHGTIINNKSGFVIQAEQIIRNNNNIKTAQLADTIGISSRTLHRRLKGLTNDTPKKFIDRVKIEYACELLLNSDKKIIDIAELTGFYSANIFRKIFSKYTGLTPTEYRAQQSARTQSSGQPSQKQTTSPKQSSYSVALKPGC